MKAHNYQRVLTAAMALIGITSAHAGIQTLFIYHKNGIEPIMISEIESIRMTDLDSDGVRHDLAKYQEFCTPDTVYRYHIGDIEKVSFEPLPTVPVPLAIDLAGEMAQYIESVDYDEKTITLNSTLPPNLSLNWQNYLYQVEPSEKVPYGFAGRVSYVEGTTIHWYACQPEEIFTSLEYVSDNMTGVNAPERGSGFAAGEIPWYAAECHLPYQSVNIMTDELKAIPVGTAQSYVDCKIRLQPVFSCRSGVYVIPPSDPDGKPTYVHRLHSSVRVNVEGSADGRCILEEKETGKMGEAITLNTKALGLGQKYSAKFKGSASAKGSMGVKTSYSASYSASALTSVVEVSGDNPVASTADKCTATKIPTHTLDASIKGSLSLSGSLTLTVTAVSDSIKAISQVYTFGPSVSGEAFYDNADIEGAHQDIALYERLTAAGVKLSPVESVTSAIKYGAETIKTSTGIKPTPATVYYAVPKFGMASYSGGTLSYPVEGTAMTGISSSLGTAVRSASGGWRFATTSHVWPGVKTFNSSPGFSASDGDIVYPTATLQGEVILCSPSYPGSTAVLTPVITYARSQGVRIVSGWPYFAKGSKGSTTVIEGTPPGWKPEDKN